VRVLRYSVPVRPVSVNRNRSGARGRPFAKSQQARDFATALAAFGQQARVRAHASVMTGPVDVLITFYFASERPDGDGPVKAVLDSLQQTRAHRNPALRRVGAGIIANDRQVRDHHVRRRVDRERPRVELVVGPAGEVFTLALVLEASSYPQPQLPPEGESVNGWDDAWERKRGPGHGGKDLTKAVP
jgi:Holliday junction resolvase RusA-like endonuclease